jgi:hypothetical protein
MSDPPAPVRNNVLVSISEKLIRVLPPAFLLLVILNCLFLGVTAWVFDHNAENRNVLLSKIVDKCLLSTERN